MDLSYTSMQSSSNESDENIKLYNPKQSHKHKNKLKHSSPKSSYEKLKSTGNTTIQNWLTKEVKIHNPENPSGKSMVRNGCDLNNSENSPNAHCSSFNETSDVSHYHPNQEESLQNSKSLEKKVEKKKKKRQNTSPKRSKCTGEDSDDSNTLKNLNEKNVHKSEIESIDISDVQKIPKINHSKIKDKDDSPRKKVKQDGVALKSNESPQSNKISKWLNKYDDNTSTTSSTRETSKKQRSRETDSVKFSEKENSSNISNQMKYSQYEANSKPKSESDSHISNETKSDGESKKNKVKREGCSTNLNIQEKSELVSLKISSTHSNKPKSAPNSSTGRKLFAIDIFSQSSNTNVWLSKDMTQKSTITSTNKVSTKSSKNKVKINPSDSKTEKNLRKRKHKQFDSAESKKTNKFKEKSPKQTLDIYIRKDSKNSTKPKFSRTDSNESYEVPSYRQNKKAKKSRTSDSFKKYGVNVPSVEEILKEQKDLLQYKSQIESLQEIDDKVFELPFSVKDLIKNQLTVDEILGCKHLTIQDLEQAFHDNLDYITGIFHGKRYSARHKRFFDKNSKKYTFTMKDLSYNTSTIVFSFEQIEHLITLLKKEFDPDDKWTSYFFQVLLPELCLKIFMDTHNMVHEEAVKYLDTRPIIDD